MTFPSFHVEYLSPSNFTKRRYWFASAGWDWTHDEYGYAFWRHLTVLGLTVELMW